MASDQPNRDPFIAAIEAKIAAWTTVLESYRAAVAVDGPAGDVGAIVSGVGSASGAARVHGQSATQLPVGIFRDKSLTEAIPLYLDAGRRKQTNREIAIGLKAGGFPTTAGNFEATVATALYRLKKDGIVLRFADGWDVASSYPDSLRGRLEKEAAPKKKRVKKKGKRQAKPTAQSVKDDPTTPRIRTIRIRRAPVEEAS